MTTTQKVLISVTAASVAVAVGTGVYGTRRVSRMQEEIRALKQQQEPFTEQIQQLRQERDRARRSLSVLQREDEQPRDQAAQMQEAPAAPASTGTASRSSGGLAERLKNPKTRETIRLQEKDGYDITYGALSKYLNLPADRLDALKNLIADRSMATMDLRVSMESDSSSTVRQWMEAWKPIQAEYDQKIQDLLGAQDYQVFKDYQKTTGDRLAVLDFKGRLSAADALTEWQEDNLISAMHEVSVVLAAAQEPEHKPLPLDMSQWTEEQMAALLKFAEQQAQDNVNRAAAILTPAQLEQFKKFKQSDLSSFAADLKAKHSGLKK
jgi:hypothetical protein